MNRCKLHGHFKSSKCNRKNTSVPVTFYKVSPSREINCPYPFRKTSDQVMKNLQIDKNTKILLSH